MRLINRWQTLQKVRLSLSFSVVGGGFWVSRSLLFLWSAIDLQMVTESAAFYVGLIVSCTNVFRVLWYRNSVQQMTCLSYRDNEGFVESAHFYERMFHVVLVLSIDWFIDFRNF